MDVDELIAATIKPLVPVCVPDVYGGDEAEYCVYTYTEVPTNFGDDGPRAILYRIEVHWFFPWRPGVTATREVKDKKRKLKRALADAGFDYPTVSDGSDDQWAELVFETEYINGEV